MKVSGKRKSGRELNSCAYLKANGASIFTSIFKFNALTPPRPQTKRRGLPVRRPLNLPLIPKSIIAN